MLEKSTYYILDAQGNQLSMYDYLVDTAENTAKYYLSERNIYGSSRLGTLKDPLEVFSGVPLPSYGTVGNRNYELNNHLGNVLAVINDIKYPLSSDNTSIDAYDVGISNVFDYSPFGAPLDGRTIENIFHQGTNSDVQTLPDTVEIYKNNFDNPPATGSPYYSTEVTLNNNLSNTVWSSSTGEFTNFNGKTGKAIAISSASADTSYITLSFDVANGYALDIASYSFYHRSSNTGYANYILTVNNMEAGSGSIWVTSGSSLHFTGVVDVSNPISGQTGTVSVVLKLYGGMHGYGGTFRMDDFTLNGFVVEENSGGGASKFIVSGGYRYGFNGQERTDEISGAGNHTTAEFWEYDSRLGRRWNIDPVVKPHESPYATFANNPIWFIDPNGADSALANGSNTWMWNTEEGDTYSSISKRTGVGIDNLREWNGFVDTKIPTGTLLHISDPTAKEPSTSAPMQTPLGSIQLHILEPNSGDRGARMYVGITFTPNEANKDEQFVWFQTVGNNDPAENSRQPNANERTLLNSTFYTNDKDAGMRDAREYAGKQLIPRRTVFNPPAGSTAFFDGPSRAHIDNGTIKWGAHLQLYKKVDDTYIKVGTIRYGFTMQNNVITPTLFRFNPNTNNDADTQYHNQQFKEWDTTH